ncbi:MAG: hypothetical protein IT323_02435, partial [Anaerolineae bacterium]|nr:hypothetical protein [Anaerolineae bacterium]
AEAGRPWRTFHPFPVQCVAAIRLHDAITGQTSVTEHHYHEGRYDPHTRMFLGFGLVDADSLGDAFIPTLRTRNAYHLGLDPDDPARPLSDDERLRLSALRRRLIRSEFYGLDGSGLEDRPFQVVQHDYATRLDPAADGRVILVPYEARTLETQYERETEPFAFREISYDEPDAHGNLTRQRMRAWRSDPGEAQPDQDVTTETSFAKNLATHNVSLPARVTQRDGDGNLLSASVTHYDGPPHVGLPEGQATTGDMTRRQTLIIGDALAAAVYGVNQPDWAALGYSRRDGDDGWWATDVSYERTGDALIVRGPRGAETRLEYDATGQYPARLTDAKGNVFTGAAEARVFQMASATDANGHTTRDVFDALGRVTASIRPGESEAQPGVVYTYRTAALPVRSQTRQRTQVGGADFLDEYQYFSGRGEFIQRVANGEGDSGRRFVVEEARLYTSRGQVCARYTPYYVASAEYAPPPDDQPRLVIRFDAIARLVAQEKADGARTVQAFVRNTIVFHDEGDNAGETNSPLVYTLDSLKRVLAVEHLLPDRTVTQRYVFDAAGRTVRIEHADGGETRYVFDLAGHILAETTPDTGTVRFVYDAAGNQVQRTLASGKTVRNRFDALERLIESRQDGAAEPEMAYTYLDAGDPAPPDGVRNRIGRPWQIRDRAGQITFAYDEHGRTVQTRRVLDAALGGQTLVTDTAYDALGRITRLTLPEPAPLAGRRVIAYLYNARGLPDSAPSYVQTAEYDVQGHLTRLVYANGAQNLLDFDPLTGRPARLRVLAADNTTLRDQTFTYDATNNLRRIDSPLALEAAQFIYDDLNQLLSADYGNGDQFRYTYADGGNIASIQALGVLNTFSYGPGSGAVTQVNTPGGPQTYAYDADGHLHSAPYGALHFDALDNLVRADLSDGRTAEYVYDFMNRRAARRLSDGALFVTADESIEFQRGTPVQWVTFGGRRILAIVNNIGAFLHHDLIGTPTLYTDGSGALLRRIALGPFGSVRFDSGPAGSASGPPGLLDQPLDGETGLICLGRRLYDPRLGRFISPDRAVGGMLRLDAWNRYVYAHNNPLRYVDPTGRFSWGDFFAILGIAIVVAALIVAGFFCGGATWAVAAGVVVSVKGLLIGTAVGIAAGAVMGGIAAGVAGGDIWAGVLLGGFLGGVAGFSGGILGAAAGGLAGSLFSGTVASYVSAGVSGLVQGALMGAATGFATGFAGGKGTAESMWTSMWKGAIIGAITGLLLGLASAYISSFNTETGQATLRIGVDKLDPRVPAGGGALDRVSFIDSSLSTGAAIARNATGISPGAGIGTFFSVGTGPGAASLINIPIGW